MSQAGITRAEMAKYLESFGWERQRRGHRATLWRDPLSGHVFPTEVAYVMAKDREPRRGT